MRRFRSFKSLEVFVAVALTLAAIVVAMVRMSGATEPGKNTISVSEVWSRPTIGQSTTGAVYFTLENTGAGDDRLVSVATPVAEKAMLHETTNDNGIMRMRHLMDGLTIGAGSSLALEPGGQHIMMIGMKRKLEKGETFPLTLTFEKAGAIVTEVAVNIMPPMQGMQRGSHNR